MGKITFTPTQNHVVDAFKKDIYLSKNFYFTGGTALSVFYLHHRESEDLDFFSERGFSQEKVIAFMKEFIERCGCKSTLRQPEGIDILIYSLTFPNGEQLKIDFNHYPYKRVEQSRTIDGLVVDSLRDIATNKLLTINQRTDVKDFVDLYFLLKEFTIWDLLYGVEAKFGMKLDMVMVASDFVKVEEFDFLPKMLVPLTTNELIDFFRKQAIEIGKKITY